MLRRKPSKIQLQIEDKEELDEARKHTAAAAATTSTTAAATGAATLLHQLDRHSKDPSVPHRIGLSSQ
ncbi:hypothetical protein CIPAW_03G252300 [Carya illinoinensis]|uniref:Anaphase-promoting complex subunit CDC26 n=1 Tax=Carya illinoinensis TaxID=32201 RepID=A0A8T1R7U7_CARIL|nr:hypothetical protein CIPAW_03G252300 [Carya illinoinensis]